jgi:hypothetical protein
MGYTRLVGSPGIRTRWVDKLLESCRTDILCRRKYLTRHEEEFERSIPDLFEPAD